MKLSPDFDLAALIHDPERVAEIAPERVGEVLAEVEALRARLWGRLMQPVSPAGDGDDPAQGKSGDRLLTVAEAAEVLAVDQRWMYRHADQLPFTRRLSPRALRFSERGLRRWMETRR